MATSFDDIYCLNQSIMTDSTISSLSDDLYYFVLNKYLTFARSQFRNKCYKDLDDATEFSRTAYDFTGNGIITDFTLSPAPASGSLIYVSVTGTEETEGTDYTYNSTTNIVSFTSAPTGAIYIGMYIIGSFADTLNITEKSILAEAMTIPFSESNLNKTKELNQIIYGSGTGFHSQANHIKVSGDNITRLYQRVNQMISEYTYDEDADDLDNLVAKNYGGSSDS